MHLARNLTLAFGCGAFGVLVIFAVLFVVTKAGLGTTLGLPSVPQKMPEFLYSRLVWGGIWGFLLVLPFLTPRWVLRGIVIGLLASAASIFYFHPALQKAQIGLIIAILVFNLIWGVAAAGWYRWLAR